MFIVYRTEDSMHVGVEAGCMVESGFSIAPVPDDHVE